MIVLVNGSSRASFFDDLARARNLIKICLSVQRLFIKSFEFNDKTVQLCMSMEKSASCQGMFTW